MMSLIWSERKRVDHENTWRVVTVRKCPQSIFNRDFFKSYMFNIATWYAQLPWLHLFINSGCPQLNISGLFSNRFSLFIKFLSIKLVWIQKKWLKDRSVSSFINDDMQFKLLPEDTKQMHVYEFSFNVYKTSLIQQSQQNKSVVEMPVYFQFILAQARKLNCFRSISISCINFSGWKRVKGLKEIDYPKVSREVKWSLFKNKLQCHLVLFWRWRSLVHKQHLWDHHSSLSLRQKHFSLHASCYHKDENVWTESNKPALQIVDQQKQRIWNLSLIVLFCVEIETFAETAK